MLSHQLPRLRRCRPRHRRAAVRLPAPGAGQGLGSQHPGAARDSRNRTPSSCTTSSQAGAWTTFPAYVKAPVGTGSTGRRARRRRSDIGRGDSPASRPTVRSSDGGVLVQEAVAGTFVMAQCVFDAGTLVAFHAVERVAGGRQRQRVGERPACTMPRLRQDLADWAGPSGGMAASRWTPSWWTAVPSSSTSTRDWSNPRTHLRPVPTWSATFLAVASGHLRRPVAAVPRSASAPTNSSWPYSGTASAPGDADDVLAEVARAVCAGRGVYADSVEELLPRGGTGGRSRPRGRDLVMWSIPASGASSPTGPSPATP